MRDVYAAIRRYCRGTKALMSRMKQARQMTRRCGGSVSVQDLLRDGKAEAARYFTGIFEAGRYMLDAQREPAPFDVSASPQ